MRNDQIVCDICGESRSVEFSGETEWQSIRVTIHDCGEIPNINTTTGRSNYSDKKYDFCPSCKIGIRQELRKILTGNK